MEEIKLNETFEYNKIILRCISNIEPSTCIGCYFRMHPGCIRYKCSRDVRSDKLDVIFKEVKI